MRQRDCFLNEVELNLYLDHELTAERTAALDSHLMECQVCARRYQVSHQLKLRIRGVCKEIKSPARLRDEVLISLAAPSMAEEPGVWKKLHSVFASRPLIPVALASTLVIILCGVLFLKIPTGRGENLVMAMVHEHIEYIEGIDADLRIVSTDGKKIEHWIGANTGINLKVPCDARFSPCGACAMDESGRKIACLFFGEGDERISFFIVPGDDSEIESVNIRQLKNMSLSCGTCTGNNYIAWHENKLLYILVSKLPEDTLLKLAENLI